MLGTCVRLLRQCDDGGITCWAENFLSTLIITAFSTFCHSLFTHQSRKSGCTSSWDINIISYTSRGELIKLHMLCPVALNQYIMPSLCRFLLFRNWCFKHNKQIPPPLLLSWLSKLTQLFARAIRLLTGCFFEAGSTFRQIFLYAETFSRS